MKLEELLAKAKALRNEKLKRIFDLMVGVPTLTVLSPIFFVISLSEKLTGEDVFFIQDRVGKGLKMFKVYKFTTMPKGSEKLGSITTISDRRLTKLGRFLRKYKLNELPQFFNVLKGNMSIVGPRPLLKEHAEIYEYFIRSKIYSVKPGLTGWGSIYFSQEDILMDKLKDLNDKERFYRKRIMSKKAELEIWYVENWNVLLDLYIIMLTVLRLFKIPYTKTAKEKDLRNGIKSL